MVRDEEIQRLINYAKGLGLKVSFSSKNEDASAEWYLDNSGIIIYKNRNKTKIETVLSLIHELGHSLHNVHENDRKVDTKWQDAIDSIDEAEESGNDTKKRQRKVIFDDEVAGTRYWHEIYKETNMKFPIWKLDAAMEFDMWHYEVFYETGKFPGFKERNEKQKEVKNKYKDK